MSSETWRHAALVAVLAWAGVGADSLSSANYGPEEAYKALHLSGHEPLVLWLAVITALTVVVISLAYVQIIRLFPNGGGGYKAATKLVHPYAGLLSGSALIVDYSLTIAISVAAASDAMFNLFPLEWLQYKPFAVAGGLGLLLFLNLRGIKESVMVLAPIVFGFLIIHVLLIGFGLYARSDELCEHALGVARTSLKNGGNFCVKIFEGGEQKAYINAVKAVFTSVDIYRPKSTRAEAS